MCFRGGLLGKWFDHKTPSFGGGGQGFLGWRQGSWTDGADYYTLTDRWGRVTDRWGRFLRSYELRGVSVVKTASNSDSPLFDGSYF